jgi:hypothetical protein
VKANLAILREIGHLSKPEKRSTALQNIKNCMKECNCPACVKDAQSDLTAQCVMLDVIVTASSAQLQHKDPDVRADAVVVLGWIGTDPPAGVAQAILTLLDDENEPVRVASMQTLSCYSSSTITATRAPWPRLLRWRPGHASGRSC